MQDVKLKTLADIGTQIRALRQTGKLGTADIAQKSGRSRDVLNRLERGKDISLSSLIAILAAMGYGIDIVRLGRPTLAEMTQRFASDLSEEENV